MLRHIRLLNASEPSGLFALAETPHGTCPEKKSSSFKTRPRHHLLLALSSDLTSLSLVQKQRDHIPSMAPVPQTLHVCVLPVSEQTYVTGLYLSVPSSGGNLPSGHQTASPPRIPWPQHTAFSGSGINQCLVTKPQGVPPETQPGREGRSGDSPESPAQPRSLT